MVELQVDAEAVGRCLHHSQPLGHDFLADAVTGNHCDPLLGHHLLLFFNIYSLKKSSASRNTTSGNSSAR